MLGIFAKIPDREPVKTRLRPGLSEAEAARFFYVASLADTLETACRVVTHPFLLVAAGAGGTREDRVACLRSMLLEVGLAPAVWARLRIGSQVGTDLGERIEHALEFLCLRAGQLGPALVVGSDSPSLPPPILRRGFELLRGSPEVVLGPAEDGGYTRSACAGP